MFNENGEVEALRIEKKAEDLAAYLADASIDSGNMQITYQSGLVVDYMNAQIDDDLPNNPDNWVDLYVESKCDPDAPTFGGSCFNNTSCGITTHFGTLIPKDSNFIAIEKQPYIKNRK